MSSKQEAKDIYSDTTEYVQASSPVQPIIPEAELSEKESAQLNVQLVSSSLSVRLPRLYTSSFPLGRLVHDLYVHKHIRLILQLPYIYSSLLNPPFLQPISC